MAFRIVVLASGRGSNFQAILDEIEKGNIAAEIVALFSDQADAAALTRAEAHGIPTQVLSKEGFASRRDYDEALAERVAAYQPDLVVLAGWMRLLSGAFLSHFPQRVLNIHPALLPSFPGLHAQRQAVEYGVKVSGCTVHFVDEGMDSGPIIAQRVVPVMPDDDEDTLAARILVEEHKLFPYVVGMFAAGRVHLENGKACIRE